MGKRSYELYEPNTYLEYQGTIIKVLSLEEYLERRPSEKTRLQHDSTWMPFEVVQTGTWLSPSIHQVGCCSHYGGWGEYWNILHYYNTPLYKALNKG